MSPEMPTPSGPKALDLLALKGAVPSVAHQQYHSEDKPGGERAKLTSRRHQRPVRRREQRLEDPGIVRHSHAETQGKTPSLRLFLCHSGATKLGPVVAHLCS